MNIETMLKHTYDFLVALQSTAVIVHTVLI